jgi:two-component system, cell cycle sensor histidine kinase and response regulator CckA
MQDMDANMLEHLKQENLVLRQRIKELEAAERKFQTASTTLKKQQQRLFSLLNRLPAYVYLQAPDHSIRFANRYFRKQFGNPTGKKCHEILRGHPEPCPQCKTFDVFKSKNQQRWEWQCPIDGLSYEVLDYPFVDFDGTLLVLELGIDITERKHMENELRHLQADLEKRVAERTEQLKGTVAKLLEEITERKKTEVRLRKSEERFALAVAGANDGIWYRDFESGEVHFSPRWKNILGYEDNEIPDDFSEWKTRIHKDDYTRVMNTLTWYLDGLIPVYQVEFRLRTKDGSYRWIHSRGACLRDPLGNPSRIAGSHTDITYRKRMEEALRESEKKYRDIFEASRDIIFFFDADARLLDINPSASGLLGYAKEELFEIDIAQTIYQNPNDRELFLQSLFSNGHVKDMEVAFRTKSGESRLVHISASVIQDRDNIITGYVGTIHDMTEHKKLEQQLLQAQKMESIGLLAGGVAHDFNNLLTVISGYGETIRDQIKPENALLQTSIDQVLHAADRARDLTHNLLSVSRKQIINPRPLRINEVIAEVHQLIARIIGEDIELTIHGQDIPLTIMADRSQLEQVLINLAANARDAMPDGGTLAISIKQGLLNKNTRELIGLKAYGPYAVISVTDNGTGMEVTVREKVFEPFFTTKEVGKGTGLGLSTSYGIIKQHNGAITVDSETGKGTTFTLYLPLVGIAVEQPSRPVHTAAAGTETILVAEDEAIVRDFLQGILQRAGYRVITARDGDEALNRFIENPAKISLVISDVVMPKKNGREIFEEIQRRKPAIKYIFISGYTADIFNQHGIVGCNVSFITKPFSKNIILSKVRELLDMPAGVPVGIASPPSPVL